MKYDIITIGGATYDITLYPNKKESFLIDNKKDVLRQKLLAFEYGAKIGIGKIFCGFGGGAANSAVSFANFGFKSAAVAVIGDDIFGAEIVTNFKKRKVSIDLIQKIPRHASDLAMIIIGPDKDRVIFRDDKVKNKLQLDKKSVTAIKKAKWAYLASLSGDWQKILTKVFNAKNAKSDLKIAWNPGQSQLIAGPAKLQKFLKKTNVLILNQDEAIQLALSAPSIKRKAVDLNNIKKLITIVKSFGPKIVVITCGKHGAWAYDGKEVYFTKIQKEQKRIDATGVGDAFGSSFVAGLELFKGDIKRAMRLGILNTASVVSRPGAQNGLLSKKDLKKIF